jgi:two-component system alkaline phosphatase synthesis response regulator PhoP
MRNALVIDDEPDVTRYLEILLSDNGWQVRTANSGERGLELASEEPPDVVLLDLMMPERGGLSTLVAFRKDERLQDVPVVLVTAIETHVKNIYEPEPDRHFERYLERFKKLKAEAFVEKPIDAQRLLRVLDEVTSGSTTVQDDAQEETAAV